MSKANYRSDFREAFNYNSSIDYSNEVEKLNKATERGDKQAQREILERNGGIICFLVKRQYQKDTREEIHTYNR